MTCAYCGQEERYGHNALCVMNTVEELRAEIERLKEQLASLQASSGYEASIMQLEVERLRALLRRHQVAAWCEEDSDLAVQTRAAIGEPKS